jgi:nucleotide-binding universal stress UspA family protein
MSTVMTRPPARPERGDNPEPVAPAENKRISAAGPGGRIVVGVDDTPAGLAALRWAVGQARSRNAPLVAVRSWALGLPRHGGRRRRARVHPHVVLYFDGTEPRDASVKLVRDSFQIAAGGMPRDVTVTVKTPEGDPGAALTDIATARDLIVVGRGEPGLRRVLHGSVSHYCRSHSRCPVVVVPAR